MENIMKRLFIGSTAAVCMTIAFSALSTAQTSTPSLGDYARSVRQNKPQAAKAPAKVYDNDTIPSATTISVVGTAPQTVADASKNDKDTTQPDAKTADAKTSDQPDAKTAEAKSTDKSAADSKAVDKAGDKKAAEVRPGQSLEERQKAFDAWKTKIADQKKKIDQLARELNDYQHNSTLAQVSVWPETQKYGQGLAEKQKALEQAKTELSELQEQARKAGVPASVAE
jgi:vacuolar-type H+-ATPase subunit I/STV1